MRMLLIASLAAISACTAAASPPVLSSAAEPQIAALDAPSAVVVTQVVAPEPIVAASYNAPPPASVQCDVRAIRTSHGIRFEASAESNRSASGEYELVITKRDRGGSSDIVQGGEYDLGAGDEQSLGNAEVSLERGGSYEARLVLRDADGVACSAERSR